MCGLLAVISNSKIGGKKNQSLRDLLASMSFRGPDFSGYYEPPEGDCFFGHNRLSIRDLSAKSNQPLVSSCGRYSLVYNGEIYNVDELKRKYRPKHDGSSDTILLFELLQRWGAAILSDIEGMFAFVFFDRNENDYIAARDAFGIKPLYYHENAKEISFCSESGLLAKLYSLDYCPIGLEEWAILRKPVIGHTVWQGIGEVQPGCYRSKSGEVRYFNLAPNGDEFNQEEFEYLLKQSISSHLVSDVEVGYFLSGGIDSTVIGCLADVKNAMSIGLRGNSEVNLARQTAIKLGQSFTGVEISNEKLIENWRFLSNLKNEPLQVPNEGMIFELAKAMPTENKVFLSGEGADELLFGYDRIFNWCHEVITCQLDEFFERYAYKNITKTSKTERLCDYASDLASNKTAIEFCEDFFIQHHLPTLLRRMDFASMAASKEARVPFVNKSLFKYMYRKPMECRSKPLGSKSPLRKILDKSELSNVYERKKIGFSASIPDFALSNRYEEYHHFRQQFGLG